MTFLCFFVTYDLVFNAIANSKNITTASFLAIKIMFVSFFISVKPQSHCACEHLATNSRSLLGAKLVCLQISWQLVGD